MLAEATVCRTLDYSDISALEEEHQTSMKCKHLRMYAPLVLQAGTCFNDCFKRLIGYLTLQNIVVIKRLQEVNLVCIKMVPPKLMVTYLSSITYAHKTFSTIALHNL